MVKVMNKKKVVTTYTVKLTQNEIEVIYGLVGGVTGSGDVRGVTRDIFHSFDPYVEYHGGDLFKSRSVKTREDFTFG